MIMEVVKIESLPAYRQWGVTLMKRNVPSATFTFVTEKPDQFRPGDQIEVTAQYVLPDLAVDL